MTNHTAQENSSFRGPALVALAVVTGAALALALVRPFMGHIGHDQAWGVYMANLWLHGAVIDGPQLVELNPPFIVWFSTLPVWTARLFHVSLIHGNFLFYDLLFAGLLGWSTSLVSRLYRDNGMAAWVFALFCTIGFMLLIPLEDIGERDQFTSLMLVPYLLLALYRLRAVRIARAEVVAIGILAGLGACLKPQYVVLPIVLEAVLLFLLRKRWWSAAPVALTAVVGLYVAIVLVFFRSYFTNIVPDIRFTYSFLASNYMRGEHRAYGGLLAAAIVVALSLYRRRGSFLRAEMLFFGAGVLAIIIDKLQGMGFRYHSEPAMAFGVVAVGLALLTFLSPASEPAPASSKRALAVGAVALLAGCAILPFVLKHQGYDPMDGDDKPLMARLYSEYPAGTPVSLISAGPWEFPAVLEQHKVWASRYMHTWWMPGVILKEAGAVPETPADQERARQLGIKFRRQYGEDLARWKPKIVVFDYVPREVDNAVRSEGYPNVVAWFQRDPVFNEQWKHYRYVGLRWYRGLSAPVFIRNSE